MGPIIRNQWGLIGNVELKEYEHFLLERAYGSGYPCGRVFSSGRKVKGTFVIFLADHLGSLQRFVAGRLRQTRERRRMTRSMEIG